MGQTHLSNAIIDSIWTFACLATPQVPTNKNTRYCTIVETHFRAVAAFIPVVSQLIVSTVLSWKMEITAGRDWAFTTGNHPCSGLPLVASIRLFASFGYICPDIKHSGHRRLLDEHEAGAGVGFQISTHHRVLFDVLLVLKFSCSSLCQSFRHN